MALTSTHRIENIRIRVINVGTVSPDSSANPGKAIGGAPILYCGS